MPFGGESCSDLSLAISSMNPGWHGHQCLSAGSPVRTRRRSAPEAIALLSPMPFGGESCSDRGQHRGNRGAGQRVTNAFRRGVLFGLTPT